MNKQKHLLFIVNSLQFGGAENHVISLLNHLDLQRFKLSLACLKEGNSLRHQLDEARMQSLFYCHVKKKIDKRAALMLARYIDEKRIDVIVCTNQYPMLYGLWGKKLATRHVKLIEVFHTTLLPNFKSRLKWFFYRHLFKRCDHVVFVSANQRNYWLDVAGMKVKASSVIHNGVDVKRFSSFNDEKKLADFRQQFGISKEDFVVGICAVLRPEKKHADLVQALHLVRQKGLSVKLFLIGDGPEKKGLEALVKQLYMEDSVIFAGFQDDVRPYIALCDCMVISSHSVETFSIAALESMAMAKPLVMSKIGGAAEQVIHEQNGYLYEKGNIVSLARYIELLSDPGRREDMGKAALARVSSEFTLEKMTKAYDNLFVELHQEEQ